MKNVRSFIKRMILVGYRHSHCGFLLSPAFFSGRQTGQSCLVQFFQWEMICLEEAQCATVVQQEQTKENGENKHKIIKESNIDQPHQKQTLIRLHIKMTHFFRFFDSEEAKFQSNFLRQKLRFYFK